MDVQSGGPGNMFSERTAGAMKPVRKNNDPIDPARRLDRIQWFRNTRQFAGLSIDAEFTNISVALLSAKGWGKFLKFDPVEYLVHPLPEHMSKSAQSVVTTKHANNTKPSLLTVEQLSFDLTQQLHHTLGLLKLQANNVINDLLIAAVIDPGIWKTDFDGQIVYVPLCNGQHLAQSSGLCIVDAFPLTDLAVGGTGKHLDKLALWFLLADRKEPIATTCRILIPSVHNEELTILPQSDGLDSEYPFITQSESTLHDLPSIAREALAKPNTTAVEFIAFSKSDYVKIGKVDFNDKSVAIKMLDELFCEQTFLPASVAAVMAAFFVDQVPSNLPWISNCEVPRILGRIAPGRPACWRRLIEQMADFRPSAMKLREAI